MKILYIFLLCLTFSFSKATADDYYWWGFKWEPSDEIRRKYEYHNVMELAAYNENEALLLTRHESKYSYPDTVISYIVKIKEQKIDPINFTERPNLLFSKFIRIAKNKLVTLYKDQVWIFDGITKKFEIKSKIPFVHDTLDTTDSGILDLCYLSDGKMLTFYYHYFLEGLTQKVETFAWVYLIDTDSWELLNGFIPVWSSNNVNLNINKIISFQKTITEKWFNYEFDYDNKKWEEIVVENNPTDLDYYELESLEPGSILCFENLYPIGMKIYEFRRENNVWKDFNSNGQPITLYSISQISDNQIIAAGKDSIFILTNNYNEKRPFLTSSFPKDSSKITETIYEFELKFSEPMDIYSFLNDNIYLEREDKELIACKKFVISGDYDNNRTVYFEPKELLEWNHYYKLHVKDVKSKIGVPIEKKIIIHFQYGEQVINIPQELATADFIFPNPANTSLKIPLAKGNNKVVISNALGEVIEEVNLNDSEELNFDCSGLPTGNYYIKVLSGSNLKHYKFVKE